MNKIDNLRENKLNLLSIAFNNVLLVFSLMIIIDGILINNINLSIFLSVVISIIYIIFIILNWKMKTITIIEDNLIFSKGIFQKSVTNIPIGSILSAEISQKLVQKIFGFCQIAIDYGESSKTLIFILSKKTANLLQEELSVNPNSIKETQDQNHDFPKEHENVYYKLSFIDLILVSLSKSSFVQKITVIVLFSVLFLELDISLEFGWIYLLIGVICLIISKIIFIIWNFNTYYGFNLTIQEDMFLIKSGLFHTKSSTLNRNKISAVQIRQDIIQRLFKTATISVSLFGLAEESGTIIFPSVKASKCNEIISNLLGEFIYNGEKNRVKKEYKLWYPNTYYGINSNLLYFSGGIIFRYQNIISLKHIDSIEVKQNFIHKIRNASKISVYYSGKKGDDFFKINGVDFNQSSFIEELL